MNIFNEKNEQEPLHAGEIFHLWSYLFYTKSYLVTLQVLINHTDDVELKALLEDLSENCFLEDEKQVETLLKETGIRLPPSPPDRPNVEVQDIPAGARFQAAEIAFLVENDLIVNNMLSSYIIGIATREDIASMFEEFHGQKVESKLKLKKLMKEKGWHVPPPLNVK